MKAGNLALLVIVAAMGVGLYLLRAKDSPVGPASPLAETEIHVAAAAPIMAPQGVIDRREKFAKKTRETLDSLPTVAKLRGLTEEEAHVNPAALNAAGDDLGQIAAEVQADPSLVPQAVEFYKSCAKRDDLPTSVRALCYSDHNALAKQDPLPEDEIPAAVRKLAQKLDSR